MQGCRDGLARTARAGTVGCSDVNLTKFDRSRSVALSESFIILRPLVIIKTKAAGRMKPTVIAPTVLVLINYGKVSNCVVNGLQKQFRTQDTGFR